MPPAAWASGSYPGAIAPRPLPPERADGRVDEPGIAPANRVSAEAACLGSAGPQALDEDVGAVGEPQHDVEAAPQVER